MPPARLRALQAAAGNDKTSPEYQRLSWDALRKSITGIVNRVNIANIKEIVPELFSENLIRGRGLFARSIMKAQAASLPFTPVFAALVSVINSKLPMVGELVVTRLISQFRRAFKRNDKVFFQSYLDAPSLTIVRLYAILPLHSWPTWLISPSLTKSLSWKYLSYSLKSPPTTQSKSLLDSCEKLARRWQSALLKPMLPSMSASVLSSTKATSLIVSST